MDEALNRQWVQCRSKTVGLKDKQHLAKNANGHLFISK